MGPRAHIWLLYLAAFLSISMVVESSARAAGATDHPCMTNSEITQISALESAIVNDALWNCQELTSEPAGGDWTLRFDVHEGEEQPKILHTRLGDFESLTLSVLTDEGGWHQSHLTLADMQSSVGEPYIYAELPAYDGDARMVIASFRANGHGPTLSLARVLYQLPEFTEERIMTVIALAALIGVMLVPLALNSAFFSVLRESFLAWHVALSLSFAALLMSRSGMFGFFFNVSADWWRIGMIMSLAATIATSLMFTRSYIEPGKLSPFLMKYMPYAAVFGMAVSMIHAASFEVLRPLGGNFHSVGMSVPLIFMVAAMANAWRNNSRAIRFQLIGWLPLLVASAVQIVTHVFPIGLQTDALGIFYFGILAEGLGTAMGVADRFFTLKRERDAARTEAHMMEELSERDPLTGLMNRRAIDARFTDLHRAGYETFALVDLDHFKRVNDTDGHAAGDAVLKVIAQLLLEEEDGLAIRMGGEEFFLLMKGEDAPERAEKLRQAIPIRTANEISELSQLVTASMGLLTAPQRALPKANFSDVYSRTDKLLYEAKEQGRNRTVAEKMQAFIDRRSSKDRRKAAAKNAAA